MYTTSALCNNKVTKYINERRPHPKPYSDVSNVTDTNPNARKWELDAPAETTVGLTRTSLSAFRAHLPLPFARSSRTASEAHLPHVLHAHLPQRLARPTSPMLTDIIMSRGSDNTTVAHSQSHVVG